MVWIPKPWGPGKLPSLSENMRDPGPRLSHGQISPDPGHCFATEHTGQGGTWGKLSVSFKMTVKMMNYCSCVADDLQLSLTSLQKKKKMRKCISQEASYQLLFQRGKGLTLT